MLRSFSYDPNYHAAGATHMLRFTIFRYLLSCSLACNAAQLLPTTTLAQDPLPPVLLQNFQNVRASVFTNDEGQVEIRIAQPTAEQLAAILDTLPKVLNTTQAELELTQFDPSLIDRLEQHADLLSRLAGVKVFIEANVTDAQVCQLSKIKSLRGLFLVGNEPIEASDAAVRCLAKCTELEQLRLDHTRITDDGLRHLKGLKKLRFLTVWHTRIEGEGFAHLKDVPIEVLMVIGSEVSDLGLQSIGEMRHVRRLFLNEIPINGDGLKYLGKGAPLEELTLVDTSITDDSLSHLMEVRSLRSLSLTDCPVTDDAIEHLSKMRHLKELWIVDTKITRDGYQRLKQELPGVEIGY